MTWRIGDLIVDSIYEQALLDIEGLIPSSAEYKLRVTWLKPHYMDAVDNLIGVIQAFLVRAGHAVILVDTCVGNDKPRALLAAWLQRRGDFLERLSSIGVGREDVTHVLCTHMHPDHVGWNTLLENGIWQPTFPRARYLFADTEFRFWADELQRYAAAVGAGQLDPRHASVMDMMAATHADSVEPLVRAGLVDLVGTSHSIAPGVSLVATPGHTPGHVSVKLQSEGQSAVITGDCIHHPIQIAFPHLGTTVDVAPEAAVQSRVRLLEMASADASLVIGSHFSAPSAVKVCRDGAGFRVEQD